MTTTTVPSGFATNKEKNLNFLCITSHSTISFNDLGIKQINSFLKFWPKEVKLIALIDPGLDLDSYFKIHHWPRERIILKSFECQQLNEFKDAHRDSRYHGRQFFTAKKTRNPIKFIKSIRLFGYNFLKDSVRFSHKVFAIRKGIENSDADVVFWLDGDLLTHSKVTPDFFNKFTDDTFVSYFLDRTDPSYTETGFHAFNVKHSLFYKFLSTWEKYYINAKFSKLDQWTDCHTFDATRTEIGKKFFSNISHVDCAHPLVNCFLGDYFDHLKGSRKSEGKSRRVDRIIFDHHPYWDNI
jgi:hypothetical protein